MGIIKGLNNRIVQYEQRSHRVSVSINDSSGLVSSLESPSAYFYAKAYPISPDASLAISLKNSSYSNGTFIFDLQDYFPEDYVVNLPVGDYIYQVDIVDGAMRKTLVQDRFQILEVIS